MDPNDDNSLFTFINNLTSIPLEKEDVSLEENKAQRLQALAEAFAINSSSTILTASNNTFHNNNAGSSTSNPLDSIFSSLLNGSGRPDTTEPVHTFSSILDGNAFATSSSEQKQNINNIHRRHFGTAAAASSAPSANGSTLQQLMPNNAISQNATTSHFTSSQDVSLPHSFFTNGNSSNSYSQIFSVGSKMESEVGFINSNGSAIGQHQGRKAFSSLFNGGGSLSSNNNVHNNASSISSLTNLNVSSAHSPLLSSANFLNFDNQTTAQSSSNNQHNHNSHQQQLLVSVNGGGNHHVQSANMQARFEGHIRALASEINATVQLYTSSIEIRKEQLIKQLDHVRNTYLLLLKQQSNGNSNGKSSGITYPRIVFARPDPSHLKVATSFGHLNSPAFAPYCQASGEGLSVAIEGEPSSFVVATRNCFNEEMLTGNVFLIFCLSTNKTYNLFAF